MAYNSIYYQQSDINTVPPSSVVSGYIYTEGTTVIGSGTQFTTEFQVFDYIFSPYLAEIRQVVNIVSDTQLTIKEAFSSDLPKGLVDTMIISSPGSLYTTGNKTTTGGSGTGLTVAIVGTLGLITSAVVNNPGSNYEVGDIVTVIQGVDDGELEITAIVNSEYKKVKRFQATKIEIHNISGTPVDLDSQILAAGKKVKFEKQPYSSSRAATDFLDPLYLDASGSTCQVTIVK